MVKRNSFFLAGIVILAFLIMPVVAAPVFSSISPISGSTAGGYTVTITGTGFTGTDSVTIGGTAATSVVVVSDTTITVTVPSHSAGTVAIIINTPDGTATASNAFTYLSAPTISYISPTNSFNSSPLTQSISVTGTGFSTSSVPTVILRRSGSTNISGTSVSVPGPNALSFTFDIVNKPAGQWDLIIINPDKQYAILTNAFEIKSSTASVTLSGITPASGVANSTVTISNLAGTGFSGTPQVYLKRTNYNNIIGSFSLSSSTKLTGSFNLNNQIPGTYQVCVENSGSAAVCGLSFVINPKYTTNGSLYITSSPSGAIVWVDNKNKGTTPVTVPLAAGSYIVKMQKTGYYDWAKRFEVTAGNETEVAATLEYAGSTTTATTTKTPTIVITTAATPVLTSSRTVPTPWAAPTAAEESPVELVVVVGAVALGCLAMRRRD